MSLLDRDLVRAINSGRCFALIGSGPSCEIGLPSWQQLAAAAIELAVKEKGETFRHASDPFLRNKDYPRLFQLVEDTLGIETLAKWLHDILIPPTNRGRIYDTIATWPFACYLTTNFDTCLLEELRYHKVPFIEKLNQLSDLTLLRADAKDLIFKIHGDPTTPDTLVLTSKQYSTFQTDAKYGYWREKISALLHMVDLVIIGYSANDPDFTDQLERAKAVAAPDRPVFMFASDLQHEKIIEYYQRYNIRVIPYDNTDGTHKGLARVFSRHEPFIAKRNSLNIGLTPIDAKTAELASAIYVFTQLRLIDKTGTAIQNAYAGTILQLLSEQGQGSPFPVIDLLTMLAHRVFVSSNLDPVAFDKALQHLRSLGFVSISTDGKVITLELSGMNNIVTTRAERDALQARFEEGARQFLQEHYSTFSDESLIRIIGVLEHGIATAFQVRGLEIARSVFLNDPVDFSDALDLLDMINHAGSSLPTQDEAAAFSDLLIETILRPSNSAKSYLAAISQGYFAYHALGLDPGASEDRLNLAKSKLWILDSSIIIPLLARHCSSHDFAIDLIQRAFDLGFTFTITPSLFNEVCSHAEFALNYFQNYPPNSPEFILAASGQAGFRPNLFVDGYIHWASTSGNPSLKNYFAEIIGLRKISDLCDLINKAITSFPIKILPFDKIEGFSQDLYSQRDKELLPAIRKLRQEYGTYRSDEQCSAEAEIVIISRHIETVFLSLSPVLNRLRDGPQTLTWKPEALYRFLSLFTKTQTGEDTLFKSMTQDFNSVELTIVDTEAIRHFVGPTIRQARMKLDSERAAFQDALGKQAADRLIDQYDQVPDEDKPFYSMRVAFYVADAERKKRISAESAAFAANQVKALTEKERKDYDRLKQKKAEKQRKAKKKKRNKQSRKKKHKH